MYVCQNRQNIFLVLAGMSEGFEEELVGRINQSREIRIM